MSAPQILTYFDNASLSKVERERALVIDQDTLGATLMPIETENAGLVTWEIRDNVKDLTFVRRAGEPFPVRKDTGKQIYYYKPGRFGEMMTVSEEYIENARADGSFAEPINIDSELMRMMEELGYRENSIIQYLRWQLMALGSVSVADNVGVSTEIARYSVNTTNAQVAWATVATAVPIDDFRAIRDSALGKGHEFGIRALACASTKTWRSMLKNTNANDFAGRRGAGLRPINGIKDYNEVIGQLEDLPTLVAEDGTYLDSTGSPVRNIPDNYVVIVGFHAQHGNNCGAYKMTRNGSNMGQAGVYAEIDRTVDAPKLPRVTRGHNGGPTTRYLNQIQVLKTA